VVAQASLQTQLDVVQQFDLPIGNPSGLEALAGRYPAAALDVPARLPAKPVPVPVGMPSELLEAPARCGDGERRVAAALYRTEEAKAARFRKSP